MPAVVDLAAMRDAIDEIGGDPTAINPLVDVDLVIDHSVQVDAFGNGMAFEVNAEREFERNQERYEFLKWGQKSFDNFSVVPPATGICHQVNLEYIAQVVYSRETDGVIAAYPDTLVGTDSHTTMVNGLGVLGWGVGGNRSRSGDARPADLDAAAPGCRLQALRQAAGRRHRHRSRADGHRDASRAWSGFQVRRVLRPGPADPAARRSRDAGQHVAGIRLDLCDLPAGRRDPALPRADRSPHENDCSGRCLRTRAGHVPHRGIRGSGLQRQA